MNPILDDEQKNQSSSPSITNQNIDNESEYVPLPSRGVFYKGTYKNMGKLKVKKLSYQEEDILTTKSYYDNGTLFQELMKTCIVDENGFKAENLIEVDQQALLMWLRIGAFGTDYTVKVTCPNEECKHKHEVTWDLSETEMPDFNPEVEAALTANGYYEIETPLTNCKVKLATSSIGRREAIAKKLKEKKTKTKSTKDNLITLGLLSSIVEVIDEKGTVYKDWNEIYTWLETCYKGGPLPISDSRYIQQNLKKISLKVSLKRDIVCPKCDHTEEGVEMPMSIYFFWPEFE